MAKRAQTEDTRRLTRRQAIVASGAWVVGTSLVASGCGSDGAQPSSSPSATAGGTRCVLTPEQTEGPYYVEDSAVRRDITEGKPGAPLELVLDAQDVDCKPIAGATVEVWHCDALGVYSAFMSAGSGGGPPPGGVSGDQNPGYGRRSAEGRPTDNTRYLRGAQRTDARGRARFNTIVPGWYEGRTPHIHLKAHVGGDEVHTGHLYFPDAVTADVYRRAPYRSHGQPSTTNASDGIYGQGGNRSTLALRPAGDGYVGLLTLGVQA